MSNPPLRWSRRSAAFAATLGALVGLVGQVWPAVAAVHVPILGSGSTAPCDATLVRAGAEKAVAAVPYGPSSGTSNDTGLVMGPVASLPVTAAASSLTRTSARDASHVGQVETINVIIPRYDGVFMVTVSNVPVLLSAPLLSADRKTLQSTGQLTAVTVSDSRYQSQPGWSISGQVSDFSGGGPTFSGAYLGWTPLVTAPNADQDVTAGPALIPGPNGGLKGGSLLAAAAATKGVGTTVLGATLYLEVPASTPVRSQSATLTLTLVERG